jgi:hypothetical protein
MSQMYYLNNSGSRWLYRPNTEYFFIVHDATNSKVLIRRKAKYFEQFGNFAAIIYSYKGRTHSSVTFSTDIKEVEWHAKQIEDSAIPYME